MRIARVFTLLVFLLPQLLFGDEGHAKKTICLNMIVKNEKDTITRCLESVLPIIDTWIIVDTGSTDGTQDIIKSYLKKIPGTLYERPWVDFSHNRQEALLLAKGKADYLLFMDADDVLSFQEGFVMPDLTEDFYGIETVVGTNNNAVTSILLKLAKTDLNWHWEGAIHEDLTYDGEITGKELAGVKYIYLHDGARSKDPLTLEKDIELLKKDLKKNPNNPRTYFYLARSYFQAGQLPLALECYEKRSQIKGGNREEIFISKLQVARLQETLQYPAKTIEKSLVEAHLDRPHRLEPLYYLAEKLYSRGEYEKAFEIAKLSLELPKEISDTYLIEDWIYAWGALLQLAHCADKVHRFPEGIQACKELLKLSLPEGTRKLVEDLYGSLHVKNVDVIQKKVEALLRYAE